MNREKEKDVSQILVDYGVYNQSGINAMKLDKELRKLLDKARKEVYREVLDYSESFNDEFKALQKTEEYLKSKLKE